MPTRNGRRIAIVSVVAVALSGARAWLGRGHGRFALALECLGRNAQGYDAVPGADVRRRRRSSVGGESRMC